MYLALFKFSSSYFLLFFTTVKKKLLNSLHKDLDISKYQMYCITISDCLKALLTSSHEAI